MHKGLTVSPSPHIHLEAKRTLQSRTTRTIMADVLIALAPTVIMACIYFRIYAAILIGTCCATAVATEWICNKIRGQQPTIGDLSAVVTGLILALSLPPALPAWAAVIGTVCAITVGKVIFGGLGCNIFNPAMVGRAFLTVSFGALMTTWTVPATVNPQMPTISAANEAAPITQATPLAFSKEAIKAGADSGVVNSLLNKMFIGEVGGCLGETSTLAILLGGAYLLIRRAMNWQLPAGVLAGAVVFATAAYLINPDAYISPVAHLAAGGLMFGAFFIATDPVTAPLTGWGMLIFGTGVGLLTMLIRIVGEYPEGVMFAVLLMNSVAPLIDRAVRPVPRGGEPNVKS